MPASSFLYKFFPKGYIPLSDFFLQNLACGTSPRSARSRVISPLWLLKCVLRAHEIVKIGNFSYKFVPKGYTPLSYFYTIWQEGGSPRSAPLCQISSLCLEKCGLTALKTAKNGNFWYKFDPNGKLWGVDRKS